MAKVKDLTGQTFERLTAIQPTGNKDKNGNRMWLCKCSCGNMCEVPSRDLNSGNTRSCGCLQRERSSVHAMVANRKSITVNGQKRCNSCGEFKSLDAFSRFKKSKDGLQSKCKACDRQYKLDNRDLYNALDHARKAKKRKNGGQYTVAEWNAITARYGNKCLSCNDTECKLTVDHIKPTNLGGKNIASNLQPLCSSCNSSKHAKHIDYRYEGYVLHFNWR